MPPEEILADDWAVYDYRKRKWGGDPAEFNCNESWEVDYLIKLILHKFPGYNAEIIRGTIRDCCKTTGSQSLREYFVEYVMKKLS
jgi:hypothetical protein